MSEANWRRLFQKLMKRSQHNPPTSSQLYHNIYQVVRQIPPGRVATYGQVAQWAGYAGYARQVGYALFHLRQDDQQVPWQRVVNRQGSISYSPFRYGQDDLQRVLLEQEGIEFDANHRIDLHRFGWTPDAQDL
jgi:methylated-DNA-protein-cysteine methyltransferase-like protein